MKNSSKNIFSEKNKKRKQKNSDFGSYSKNTNHSEKNERFLSKI